MKPPINSNPLYWWNAAGHCIIAISSNHLRGESASLRHVTPLWNKQCKPFKRRDCSAWGEENEGGKREDRRGGKGEKWRGAETHKLTHPAVACLHSSSGTYASLDCLKERPAFPHHLNRLVPLLFHSLEGSPIKTHLPYTPVFPPHFCLRSPNHLNSRWNQA